MKCLGSIPKSGSASYEAAMIAQVIGILPPIWETSAMFLVPVLVLA